MLALAVLVAQLAATVGAAAFFNLAVTSPYFYRDTYISCAESHVGAGTNLMLISAAPDPNFSFEPSADDASVGMLQYQMLEPDFNFTSSIGLTPTLNYTTYEYDPDLEFFATGFGSSGSYSGAEFTFGPDGELIVAANGWLVACNTSAYYYPTLFAVNFFNGTGQPDYTQCLNISIARL